MYELGRMESLSLRGVFCLNQLKKATKKIKAKTSWSSTLTAMLDAILEDLVFASKIMDRSICVKLEGSRL